MKKLFFFLALLLPIGAWAGETVIATDHWAGPYFFSDDGVGATCNMTSEGLAIYNPKVQELLWTPQAMVIADMTLEENHTYKVIVSAKIPSAGKLQLNLSNWESDWDKSISVNASNDFQDFEFLYENCPYYTESGHVMFQNGGIKGTSIVRNVKVLDMTNSGKVIAEKKWDGPYWFDDEGTGATCTITDEGLAITNPNVQEELWKPQTWVLKYAKLKHSHTYKVVVNAKIPSDGFLQVQLGSFEHGGQCDQKKPVTASNDFQDYEFVYGFYQSNDEDGHVLFQNGGIKGTCVVRSISIIDLGTDCVGDDYWAGSQMFIDDGVDGATCNMTSNGLAIYNPQVQEVLWKPQAMQINTMKLEENHSYKVVVNAKIPSAGKLQLNLSNWGTDWNKNISVNASNDFQNLEFLFENCPYTTQYGHLMFQNGGIKGTSIIKNVQVLDITNGEVVVAEKNWDGPYWFGDEGTDATFTVKDEGLAITNPKVQDNLWMPQTMVLKDAKLQKNHSYSVIVEAKIPSKGDLQVQLGSWDNSECRDQSIPVLASNDFQTFEFTYQDFPVDAVDGHVLFQSGGIAGTCVIRRIIILDLGDDPVDLAYNYNDEDHTAEVIKNDNGKYKGDVTIPATVSHNGKDYTVTSISENAFLDCTTLTSISIPATVTKLYGSSFINCAGLQEITVDPANTVYDSRGNSNAIFHTATNKLSVGCVNTVIPEGTTRIGDDAFWGRWGLEHINLPNTVKEIGMHAFAFCFLKEITLPEGVEKIETEAFWSTDLASVTLPASLKTLEDGIFMECTQLTKVTVHNQSPLAISDGEIFSNRANATLYVPAGSKKAYKAASIWKEFKGIVEAEHNSVYSYDLTAYLGASTEMEINLENWDPFTAYQFDIVLPEGITLEKYTGGNSIKFTRGKRNTSNHNISVTDRGNNTYRVIGVSTKNNVISGNDGALLTVYLIANENMGKKTCQAEIKNVIMTTPEEKQVNFDPTTVTITTKTLLLGDSNDDNNVNVTDLVATVNYILGRPSDKFNKTAADITKNHVVNINDVISGLDLIKNATRGARMRTRTAEASNDKMTISDLSISAGMTKQLQVELTNEGTYVGFQFDLVLPEGIKMTSYSTTARIPEGTTVDDNETEGAYRFIGYTGGTPISGNSGSILNITVKADENLKGRHLTGYLRNVNLGTGNDEGPTIEETPFKITDETSGDLNKNGKLDAADVKAIAEQIMKGEYKAKADVNGDSKVNAADIVVVTNEINKK